MVAMLPWQSWQIRPNWSFITPRRHFAFWPGWHL